MLTIEDNVLQSANITATELRNELAVYLYSKNKLSFGQARKIAGLDILQFQELLFNNNVALHYSASDLEDDYKSIQLFKK